MYLRVPIQVSSIPDTYTLWPFPLYQVFPGSEYYGHSDCSPKTSEIREFFRSHFLALFYILEDSPKFIVRDSARYLRWWLPDNLYCTFAAPDRRGGM